MVLRLLPVLCLLLTAGCDDTPPMNPEPVAQVPEKTPAVVPQSTTAIQFVDQAADWGIEFTYRNSEEQNIFSMLETLGGGVGILDYDLNGWPDLLFPGGGRFEENRITGLPSALYRNLGSGVFEEVSGLALIRDSRHYSHGMAVGDFNVDGFPDVLVTGFGGMQLFTNQGDGTFQLQPPEVGLTDPNWTVSAAWGDVTGDGLPDLYVTRYVNWSLQNNPVCRGSGPSGRQVCKPADFQGLPDSLYQNNGDGNFTDISAESGLNPGEPGKGMGALLADLDGDADLDIYVTNDTMANFLYRNLGGGKLEEIGVLSGTAFSDVGRPDGSMGVALGDFNGDLLPDIWVTNYVQEAFAMYRNSGEMGFLHVSYQTGLTAVGAHYVGWGTTFVDLDHDRDQDLVAVNGHVYLLPDNSELRQPPLVYENLRSQRFRNVASLAGAYTAAPHRNRGLALADLDLDGREDVVVSSCNEPVAILMNRTNTGEAHWIGLRLTQRSGSREGTGAAVILLDETGKQYRQLYGGGYASTHQSSLVFGLGNSAAPVAVEVHWPGGKVQVVKNLQPDRYHLIVEEPES